MALPFGLGKDFPEKLETPRPFDFLQELDVIVPVTEKPEDPEKHDFVLGDENKVFVFVGSNKWKEMNEEKEHGLNLSAFQWLRELFAVLEGEKERPDARRLAGCWYYTASEACFDEDSESNELDSDEEDEAGRAVTGTLLGIMNPNARLMDDDEDEDADFVPHSISESESFDSDVEPMDEGEPEFKKPSEPFRAMQQSDNEENEENEEMDEGDDQIDEEKLAQLEQMETEIREAILKSVAK